ncbi:DUF2057 domain-containing protein [Vibrio europaeus]|uniref:DUF2057 domain-containing protein n=1 Tax=Vibrio europaeus TaxID=300876 RepID=A0AAE7AXL8_9VIBR|nr:DUF2057 domain-containing protein [Vibrio europaeus]MDC5807499.1 DUF2057 domain-containing protein [Vibrio europaeus]MDC5810780.1 DUF2057 domain-containing protein [Vibrio europaeus]MDC5824701.1 DUF2057 domain-containing protein [Vibrio europaeus]MDC5829123.1 DUF2057 domain-containing protein [Vibrio europaeus]MDC5836450.1 DUF2057 domain-containing protein [Vibrio europaeus]
MKKCVIASLVALMVGCTALDSESSFTDVVAQVETKQNYYLVEGKSFSPDVEVSKGAQLTQSNLALNYVAPHHQAQVPSSFIVMEVKYFKNYSEYKYVELDGKEIPLKSLAPTAETCSDICTQRQLFRFDVSEASLLKGEQQGLRFAIASSEQNKVFFDVAAGYIKAIRNSIDNQPAPNSAAIAAPVVASPVISQSIAEKSKSQEMAMYWYEQLDSKQQENVTNWAVSNRKSSAAKLETANQAEQMFSYWFNQASETEKKMILVDLISK